MKSFYIALNTLSRSFRSAFALVFMFVIPLLITGMFALMFGKPASAAQPADDAPPPAARLVVANLDRGDPAFRQDLAALLPSAGPVASIGSGLVQTLGAPGQASLLQLSQAPSAEAALGALRSGQADAALVIPTGFSAAYLGGDALAVLELYTDPARPVQAAIVGAVLAQYSDTLSGMKIALQVALARPPTRAAGQPQDQATWSDGALTGQIVQGYLAARPPDASQLLEDVRPPASPPSSSDPLRQVVAPIMGGMMIFFAFFTGCTTAQGILREHENGTLARLFTTPTELSAILGGKFAAVGLTVLVQVSVLLAAGRLLFAIQWGPLANLAMAALGIVACAATFGIFATSLLKNNRQAGMVFGGLLTVTGMLGMMGIFTGSGTIPLVSLFTPQGWGMRGLMLALNGATLDAAALNLLALLALSLAFFLTGRLRYQKRFA